MSSSGMGADAAGDGSTSHGASPTKAEAPQHHLTIEGKLIVVGDSNSGKTSIISAFTRGELNTATRPSIGVAYSKKSITVPGATVNFQVWDTAGQEKFRSINTLYYRNAAAAVLVFDITSRSSFDNIVMWLDEIRRNGASNMVLGLAGNKADLKNVRQVSSEEAKEFADSQQMVYFETSAKTGIGVTELFKAIARKAPEAIQASAAASTGSGTKTDGFRILSYDRATVELLDESVNTNTGSKSCCG